MCALVACRMCLAVGKRMRSIAGTPLEDFYERITNIQLENKYGKPVLGCNVCLHLLKKCQTFIEDVGRADETLTRICGAGSEISEQSRLLAEVAKPRASLGLSGVKCAWYDPRQPPDCKVKIEVEIESDYSPGNTATSAVASTSDSMALEAPGSAELCKIKIEPEEVEEPPEDDTDPVDERYQSYPQPPLHALSPDCILGATPEWRAEAQPSGRGKGIPIRKRKDQDFFSRYKNLLKAPIRIAPGAVQKKTEYPPDTLTQVGDKKMHKCPYCPKLFDHKSNLIRHVRTHTGETPYHCSQCNQKFSQKSQIISHIRTHTGERPFKCTLCSKAYKRKGPLTVHIRTHTGEKPYQCMYCNKAFREKSTLTCHIRSHTGERPHQCTYCHKGFVQIFDLTRHMTIHTGEKPYKCTYCGKAFNRKSNLTIHLRRHTTEKPYQCNHCSKAYIERSDLINHVRMHTGEKPYKCSLCSKAFRIKKTLNKHITRTHVKKEGLSPPPASRGRVS